eukprot:8727014-Ditylum_brightwellii.AAC.1
MGWMGRQEKLQYGVCVGLCHQKPHPLHGEHIQLKEYGHPVAIAADVGMIVCNPLIDDVYTTHPVVVVIDE